MARKPPDNASRLRFARLLAKHLADGRRPTAATGEPWSYAGFADGLQSTRDNDFVSARSVSNWCKGQSLPEAIEPILRKLFGPTNENPAPRAALRAAFQAARNERNAAAIKRAKPDSAGPHWVAEDDTAIVIDRSTRPTDKRAAVDPLQGQLQAAACDMAAELAHAASRLDNTRTWGNLSSTAGRLRSVLSAEPAQVPGRLGEAYAAMLRLGQFLETDARVQRDPRAHDEPLDPDIHGLLTSLVRTGAPWLRGFPSVAAMDDRAGKALLRPELFQPAREFTRIARANSMITDRDADEMEMLGDAVQEAGQEDFQGQKAGNRLVNGFGNLVLKAAGLAATLYLGAISSEFANHSNLARLAGRTLGDAEAQIEAFAATRPHDLGEALRALVKEGQRQDDSLPLIAAATAEPPIPDDVEEQARTLILEGQKPPAAWAPFIRKLAFGGTHVSDVTPLAGLTALLALDLDRTNVSDVTPLAGLTALQTLDLDRTQVRDVTPLAGLTALHTLMLDSTQVSDITPLAELTALETLYLSNTRVSDVTPLAGLTALETLSLSSKQVRDVTPLARLTALQRLSLSGTRVNDITTLAGLIRLRILYLDWSLLYDVAPLSRLTALQTLSLKGTRVSDITPLAALTALQWLDLVGTQVIDILPLAGLTKLRNLFLNPTQVWDVRVLEHLENLKIRSDVDSLNQVGPRLGRRRRHKTPKSE